jgi:transcriptional regulator with XRE-family HTH domain
MAKYQNLHVVLRHLRNSESLTQGACCSLLGISPAYICQIEKGIKVPTIRILQKYSKVFQLQVSEIIFMSEYLDKLPVKITPGCAKLTALCNWISTIK